jgi:drug/metabolite transporter (DMT)-like permease
VFIAIFAAKEFQLQRSEVLTISKRTERRNLAFNDSFKMLKPELKQETVEAPNAPDLQALPRPMVKARSAPKASVGLIILAFAAVYLIWGSTYLAIKYAIGTLPPFLMAATRFLSAGAILFAWASLRGERARSNGRTSLQQWRRAFIIGALLILGGNGGVTWAERYLPSSLAALLVATEPLWVVLLNWTLGGARPNAKVVVGLFTGLAGVGILVSGGFNGGDATGTMSLIGAVVVIAAGLCWAGGSVFSIRRPVQTSAPLASGMQMLAGGTLLLVLGSVTGEFSRLNLGRASWLSIGSLLYLIVFGSIVAFTAYGWLLRTVSPARAATYAYVNPMVAVVLGWFIASEPLTVRTIVAAIVIVASVALITTYGKEVTEEPSVQVSKEEEVSPCPTYPCA